MRSGRIALAAGTLLATLAACTDIRETRVDTTPALHVPVTSSDPVFLQCRVGSAPDSGVEFVHSIEEYADASDPAGGHFVGVVEFDDQGWMYDEGKQLEALRGRIHKDLRDPALADADFVTVVFVHGWHHNAHDDDCNVNEFRVLLQLGSDRYQHAFEQHEIPRRIHLQGVYLGWRGESIDAAGLRYATIFDRKGSAENVAKGSVREVFAALRKVEWDQQAIVGRADRVRSIVIGHSFGGLVAFNALSESLLNELVLNRPVAANECLSEQHYAQRKKLESARLAAPHAPAPEVPAQSAWPDVLVLINPAFEASRFEPLHQMAESVDKCPAPAGQKPRLIVVTADNDSATGTWFPAFRRVGTVFDGYDESTPTSHAVERQANWNTIGFVDRYRTHRLCLTRDTTPAAFAYFDPPDKAQRYDDPAPDPNGPIWVLRAPPDIINGHDGFLFARPDAGTQPQPYLLNWLVELHVQKTALDPIVRTRDSCRTPE